MSREVCTASWWSSPASWRRRACRVKWVLVESLARGLPATARVVLAAGNGDTWGRASRSVLSGWLVGLGVLGVSMKNDAGQRVDEFNQCAELGEQRNESSARSTRTTKTVDRDSRPNWGEEWQRSNKERRSTTVREGAASTLI